MPHRLRSGRVASHVQQPAAAFRATPPASLGRRALWAACSLGRACSRSSAVWAGGRSSWGLPSNFADQAQAVAGAYAPQVELRRLKTPPPVVNGGGLPFAACSCRLVRGGLNRPRRARNYHRSEAKTRAYTKGIHSCEVLCKRKRRVEGGL